MKRYLFGMIMAVAMIASAPQKSEAYTTGLTGAYYTSVANYYTDPSKANFTNVLQSYSGAYSDSTSIGNSPKLGVNIRMDMLRSLITIVTNQHILQLVPAYLIGVAPVSPE